MILRAKVRIIRMRKVPFIDSTGLHNLSVMCEQSEEQGIQVVLSGGGASCRNSIVESQI